MSGVILATGLGAFGATAAASVGTGAMIAAGIGAGTTIYGGAKSFSDANKARKRGEAAQRAADKAIEEARKRVDVNAYEQLSIAKEPYELMREALLVSGATGLQSAVEGSSRGAAATAGRIQMAQGQQQAAIRAQQAQQMDEINRLVADEDLRRQQQLAGIAMEEAAGAQLAIRDAEEDRAAYIAQGVGTLGSIAEGLSSSYAEGTFGKANTRRQQRLAKEAALNEKTQGAVAAARRNAALRPLTIADEVGEDEGPFNAFPVSGTPMAGLGQISTGEFVAPQIPGTTQAQPMISGPGGYDSFGYLEYGPEMRAVERFDDGSWSYYAPREDQVIGNRIRVIPKYPFDRANRVSSIYGDPNIPDKFGNTMAWEFPSQLPLASFGLLPSQQATAGPLATQQPPPFQIPGMYGNYIGPDMRPTEYVRNFRNRQLGIQ